MPSTTVLDARRISPWGHPLSYGVAAHARQFIALVEEHPEGWDWGWGEPVTCLPPRTRARVGGGYPDGAAYAPFK